MNQNPEPQPDQELNANAFREYVNANPDAAYEQWQQAQQQAQQTRSIANVTPSSSNQSSPMYTTLNPQALTTMIAQIVAQTLAQQPLPLPPVVNFPVSPLQATAPATHQSEKLPDTAEYDGDRDCLNVWEQSLRQHLNMNHDRYPTDREKIAYAESQLIIGKKAHNLMGQY